MQVNGRVIGIRAKWDVFAKKYSLRCELRNPEGPAQSHSNGLTSYRRHLLINREPALVNHLNEESVAYSKNNPEMVIPLHRKAIEMLNRSQNPTMELDRLKAWLAESDAFLVIEVDDFVLLFPKNYIEAEISERNSDSGVIPIKVICNGELRVLDIRFTGKKWWGRT
ncbi:MAG: hypothetical protein HQ596_05440 [Candidatus Saganbacteria bacterium]|nr:hypothetical protein [Candidatus Saganbacteria bacterium]